MSLGTDPQGLDRMFDNEYLFLDVFAVRFKGELR